MGARINNPRTALQKRRLAAADFFRRQQLQRIRGAASIWTPAALFSAGQQGVWYEPRPEYLYQDSAGTTPVTADGQPVGLMDDRSPNDHDAAQSTASYKPLYPGLSYDGVDDRMSAGDVPSLRFGTENFTVSFAVRPDTISGNHGLVSKRGTGSPGGRLGWGVRQDGNSIDIEFDDGTASSYAGDSVAAGVFSAGVWSIITVEFDRDAGECRAYSGGSLAGTLDISALGDVSGTQPLVIGADATFVYFFGGNIKGPIIREGLLAASERQSVEQYLANLAGVTL